MTSAEVQGALRPRCWRGSNQAEQAAAHDGRVMSAPVFARWMRFDESGVGLVAFAFDVHHLSTDHAGGSAPPTPRVPMAQRKLADDVDDRCGGRGELGDRLEGECLQCVAGEDCDGFAEGDVAGGFAAAQIVVVERGQIVVDQRVGVDHFDRSAEVGRGRREFHGRRSARPPCREWGAGACRPRRWSAAWRGEWNEAQRSGRAADVRERRQRAWRQFARAKARRRSCVRLDCTRAQQEQPKHEEREKTEHVAEELVPGAMPAHVDDRGTGGQRDGEQAVVAPQMLCDECAVAEDLPRREVAQIEDECRRLRKVELEMVRCDTAHCLRQRAARRRS